MASLRPSAALCIVAAFALSCMSCELFESKGGSGAEVETPTTFDGIVQFFQEHGGAVVLDGHAGSKVLVSPTLQGRIFTMKVGPVESTGLVNFAAIAKGPTDPSFNNFGGLDRLWLAPEGGQFSLYFEPGIPFPGGMFTRDKWKVPAALDSGAYQVTSSDAGRVVMTREMDLVNYSGTKFKIHVEREVSVIPGDALAADLGVRMPEGISFSGVRSVNTITNVGGAPWKDETGLVSVWILGQFNPSESAVIVGPFRPGADEELGPRFNDDYFGKLSQEVPERFKVLGNAVLLRADARREGKFGVSQKRSTGLAGSIAFDKGLLTIVKFDLPQIPERYANQSWETKQADPFKGDTLQSYNAGPEDKASGQLAAVPFYELESTSPVRALLPGEKIRHTHTTYHFQGDILKLAPIAYQLLGVQLGAVKDAMLR